jgi:hypothetical protein
MLIVWFMQQPLFKALKILRLEVAENKMSYSRTHICEIRAGRQFGEFVSLSFLCKKMYGSLYYNILHYQADAMSDLLRHYDVPVPDAFLDL